MSDFASEEADRLREESRRTAQARAELYRRARLDLFAAHALSAFAGHMVADGRKTAAERAARIAWDFAEAMEAERNRRIGQPAGDQPGSNTKGVP